MYKHKPDKTQPPAASVLQGLASKLKNSADVTAVFWRGFMFINCRRHTEKPSPWGFSVLCVTSPERSPESLSLDTPASRPASHPLPGRQAPLPRHCPERAADSPPWVFLRVIPFFHLFTHKQKDERVRTPKILQERLSWTPPPLC